MNKLYISSSLMWQADSLRMIDMVNHYHISGIEVWAQQADTCQLNLERLRENAEKTGVNLIVHAKSWDLNYASIEKGIRVASIQAICQSVDIAQSLGAREVTVHPPRYSLKTCEMAKKQAYQSLTEIVDYADAKGITISMEIMEHIPKEMATTPEAMKELVKDLPVTYTVDIAHCHDTQEFFEAIKQLKDISKLHISNKRGTTLHTPLDDGDYDFKQLFPEIQKLMIPMVVEGYDDSDDYTILKRNLTFMNNL